MRFPKNILFVFTSLLVFLLAATLSCVIRSKYSSLPEIRAGEAGMEAAMLYQYSSLEYTQAGPEQAREGLLQYIRFLERVRNEHIDYPKNEFHADLGLAYLRLYRLESGAGDADAADAYMTNAQKELARLGWKEKDLSREALVKLIETRTSNDVKFYDGNKQTAPAPRTEQTQSKEKLQ